MHTSNDNTGDWQGFAARIGGIDIEGLGSSSRAKREERFKQKLGMALIPPLLMGAAVIGAPLQQDLFTGQQESEPAFSGLSESDATVVKNLDARGIGGVIAIEQVQETTLSEPEGGEPATEPPSVQIVAEEQDDDKASSTESAAQDDAKVSGIADAVPSTGEKESEAPSSEPSSVVNGATSSAETSQQTDDKVEAEDYYILLIGNTPDKDGSTPVLVSHISGDKTTYARASEMAGAEAEKAFESNLLSAYKHSGAERASKLFKKETGQDVQIVAESDTSTLNGYLAEKKEAAKEKAKLAEEQRKFFTIIDDGLWFDQNQYGAYTYQGGYSIASHGCGLCATTVALDMLLGKDWDPVDVSDQMKAWADANGGIQYCVSAGTAYGPWSDTVEGAFGVSVYKAGSAEEVKKALAAGAMVVAGNGGDVFKTSGGSNYYSGGHLICFYKTDGENVWAKDSAGSAGGPSILYDAGDFDRFFASSGRTYIIARK